MVILRSSLCVVILLAATASRGAGQVLAGPEGPVEFVGLEHWAASELLDAFRQITPDQPLHACAAVMTGQLGFADAAVRYFDSSEHPGWEPYTVIIGVEDRARVRYRTAGNGTIDLPEPWRALKSVAEKNLGALSMASQLSRFRDSPGMLRQLAEPLGFDPTALDRVWELIDVMDGEQDRLLAHEILAHDASWSARATAVSALVNFSEHDAAWHDLVSAMIDPDARVQGAADAALRGLTRLGMTRLQGNRPVRWNAARESLLALLDGTNPYVFSTVLRVLAATGIDPAFGRQLIREAPDLLLAHVSAEHETTRESAIKLLKIVSGEDFGAEPDAWSEWLNDRTAPFPEGWNAVVHRDAEDQIGPHIDEEGAYETVAERRGGRHSGPPLVTSPRSRAPDAKPVARSLSARSLR